MNEIHNMAKKGSSYGLESTLALAGAVGDPQNKLRFIHIAGTNGKGSVLAYISSALINSGYKTGIYTSPTVMSYYERIQIDNKEIDRESYCRLAAFLLDVCKKNKLSPTVFELETVMAFLYFARNDCDFVVLEAGLGGRLDATNIISTPEVCVITGIGKDHTDILGKDIAHIAAAKAGIIKSGIPICIGEMDNEARLVIRNTAREMNAPVSEAEEANILQLDLSGSRFDYKHFRNMEIGLIGEHQIRNAALALEALDVLEKRGFRLDGIRNGMKRAYMPGRMEIVCRKPLFICDGAHNPQGAASAAKAVRACLNDKNLIVILGILKDKDYVGIIKEIGSLAKRIYAVSTKGERGLDGSVIQRVAIKMGIPCTVCTPRKAAELAIEEAEEKDVILACGSFTYLGEVISYGKSK